MVVFRLHITVYVRISKVICNFSMAHFRVLVLELNVTACVCSGVGVFLGGDDRCACEENHL